MMAAEFLFDLPATLLAVPITLGHWLTFTSWASLFDRLTLSDEAIDMPGMDRLFRKCKANGNPIDRAAFEE